MDMQMIKDNLKELELKKRYLLCKYESAFDINNFVQVVLRIKCDEPDYVISNESHFDNYSRDNRTYVKADSFSKFVKNDMDEELSNKPLNEQIELLGTYLKDKLIVVNPYYYFKSDSEDGEKFYKNGTVIKVIPCDEEINHEYFCVPEIPNQNSFDSFKSYDEFPLPLVSKELIGMPNYLFYNQKIYKVEVEASSSNDTYWKAKDNTIKELNVNYSTAVWKNQIIDCNNGFVFIDKTLIFTSKIIDFNVSNIQSKSIQNKDTDEIKYESSKAGKAMQDFFEFTKENNLCYSLNDIYNFYTCVCASQLIILAGMSGTGKTKLPLKFAEYFNMTEDNKKLLFVPVSPSFTEPSDILGFLNPNNGLYTSSETGLVEFLKHAEEKPDEMHMVIFDEMNLAQIEYWFAPFISILEKDLGERKLRLYSKAQRCINDDKYTDLIEIKNNIIFVGTINLDETTKNISDRLLYRSFIINLKKESFVNYKTQQSGRQQKNDLKNFEEDFKIFMPEDSSYSEDYISSFSKQELEFFDRIHTELNKVDSQKGVSFRCVKNIALYLKNKPEELDKNRAFDYAFKQTVMKKINGSIESIGEFIGSTIDNNNVVDGILIKLFDEFSEISDFTECRNEARNKVLELKKYGYAR